MALQWDKADDLAVAFCKTLAADAVEKAGNGHPGAPISLAPAAYLLFNKIMQHNPADPKWIGRDRFVLSGGHASLLLYVQIFISGYGLEKSDLESLRTIGSITPGHPEYGHTTGVEMTTGPLGQGLASAVGMAMACRHTHGIFTPDKPIGEGLFDYRVYVTCGDGDLQEGVTSEACSIAGTQKLNNLIVIWDDNQISIEDDVRIAFTEDVLARYRAYGWHTIHVDWRGKDPYKEDVDALYQAILEAQTQTDKPTLIRISTIMAWPSPSKQGTGSAHGAALGADEIRGLKEALGINPDEQFGIPDELVESVREKARIRGQELSEKFEQEIKSWKESNPEKANILERLQKHEIPDNWTASLPSFNTGDKVATRSVSGKIINALNEVLPELWGGSADIAHSNNTDVKGVTSFLPENCGSKMFPANPYGRNLHFGVREHAMGAILNGIYLAGFHRPYGGTFFVFADYMRPSVRLAALMKLPVIYVWTHDSIGVGEDGPTHQPIEHLWSYRAIPNLNVVRPADARETVLAWKSAIESSDSPTALVLSRQNLPVLDCTKEAEEKGFSKGAYVISDSSKDLELSVILIATGSEVSLALEAKESLESEGIGTRVVSAPCLEWFTSQNAEYKESVLPSKVSKVSIEAGSVLGWRNYVGDSGASIGIDHYGESGAGDKIFEKFGFTVSHVVSEAKRIISAK